ncbi:MAG TPA: glycosyltransferase, partial [Polyangiales bacterium]|nr:glycosyltransferase [Polyangiales bacterium]
EQNLRSFFEQAYPAPLQFVFSSTEPNDPGIVLARRIAAEYPQLRVWFATSDSSFGVNPKVSNLAGALRWAEHDLILQTDANVRVRPDYFQAVVREYRESGAALLGGLIAGSGERSIGAVLDNIQLTTFTTPGICLAQELVGIACVIGKSIVYRKSELESLGGFERVKDVLAEDYVLGQAYVQAGKRVMLSRLVVENVNVDASLARFLSRHSRWLKMRVVVHVGGFAADLLSNATFFAVLAAVQSGFEPSLLAFAAIVIAYKMQVDLRLMTRLRGTPLAWRHRACMPLRDLLLPCVWIYALFSRTTEWRGERFRLSRGSLLTPLTAADTSVELEQHGDA